jgi:hypothetical protein
MQYSIFTHGTAVEAEDLSALAGYDKVGWGTRIFLKEPLLSTVGKEPVDVRDEFGPGSWFHIPLTSTLTTFGVFNPFLVSVTLLIETQHCRITDVHVYDGAEIVQEFGGTKGEFLYSRNSGDINPNRPLAIPEKFENTFTLDRPHKVFSAIGISFFARAYNKDYNEHGFARTGRYPQAILTVSGAGAQYRVADRIQVPWSDRISNVFSAIAGLFRR